MGIKFFDLLNAGSPVLQGEKKFPLSNADRRNDPNSSDANMIRSLHNTTANTSRIFEKGALSGEGLPFQNVHYS
jgi:hypothetical protein